MPLRPWSDIVIRDCAESLAALPAALFRIEPHPYVAVGAPYGEGACPFRLRTGVIQRLLQAQTVLSTAEPGYRLAIFDAWRPIAVQRFMVDYAIAQQCSTRGLTPRSASPAVAAVIDEVSRFWAPPSLDPATPPPHSTGAAVDLTLLDGAGELVDMGSDIDAIGAVSEPHHYRAVADTTPDGVERQQALEWDRRRRLLADAMESQGFAQHPNEWWHFSYGDQLWAWQRSQSEAIYGRASDG